MVEGLQAEIGHQLQKLLEHRYTIRVRLMANLIFIFLPQA